MNPSSDRRFNRLGYLYVVAAATFWASAASASKFLFNSGVTPFQLVQLRITTAAGVLFLWLFFRHRKLLRIARRDIGYFLLLGTFGMAAINITYLYAISKLNVAAALVLEYLAPVIIALYTVLFQHERLSLWTVAAMAATTVGCTLVVGAYNLDVLQLNLMGILSGLGAAAAFAWWSVYGEYGMRRYNPWTVLFYALLVAAIEWNLLHPPLEAFLHPYPLAAWGWIFYIGVGGAILPFGFYYEGVNRIRSTRASITSTLEPIMAGVFSFVFLGEVMAPLQILGGVLALAAIVLLQLRQEHDEKAPAVVRMKQPNEVE
ncbi:MAG TPA: EamA family transporter [Desulfobacterales bacterium]|nr:EamA family transporter [Desulfobacterales bacterium]